MHKKNSVFFLLMLLLSTSGCFRSPERTMATQGPLPYPEHFIAQAETSEAFTVFYPNQKPWWTVFEDPQLDKLIRSALIDNPSLKQAEAGVMEAQARAKAIRSKLFPRLDAGASDTWAYLSRYGLFRDFFPTIPGFPVPSKFNELDLSLNFSYEFDFWGKNKKLFASALESALADEMERRQACLVISAAIAESYFAWQSRFAALVLRKKELEDERALQLLAKNRYLAGIESVDPVRITEDKTLAVLAVIEEIEKELTIDEIFLKTLIGKGPDHPLDLQFTDNPANNKAYLPDTLGLDTLAARPDVAAKLLKVEVARKQVGIAKTRFYPDVNLSALAGFSSLSFSKFFLWASRTGGLRPAIHLPLFHGGELIAGLEEQVAAFNRAVYEYDEQILLAAEETAKEITTVLSLQEQLAIQNKRVSLRSELLETASYRFRKGIDSYDEVLSARKRLTEEEAGQVLLHQAMKTAAVRLIKATGGGTMLEGRCP